MGVRLRTALVLAALVGTASSPAVAESSVAAPQFVVDGKTYGGGTTFFLAVDAEMGAAAVGAAHSFDLEALARAREVLFERAYSREIVTVSSRFLVPPGRPFRTPGGSLHEDFVVFALDRAPRGVRTLTADSRAAPEPGERVQIIGAPANRAEDQDSIFGSVVAVTPTRIEVELDTLADLRGWGGAPVLSRSNDRVVGLLQAAWPAGATLRVAVSSIAAVRDALRSPLERGRGLPFAGFADRLAASARATPSAAETPAPRREARLRPPAPPREPRALLGEPTSDALQVLLEVEHPPDGSVMGDATGAFLAGRAVALSGELRRLDIVLVVDTSGSTNEPSGNDINGNGVVGRSHLGGLGGILGLGSTDPGDSILAAEVAAARALLEGLDARSTRVGLVTFAGEPTAGSGGLFSRRTRSSALTEEPLTTDYARIERSLDRIMERGAQGMTHMAAGIDQATIELIGLRGGLSEPDAGSDKFVLFFTDGQPTLPYEGLESRNVMAVFRAAERAQRAGVRIHSFAIGPDALDGPIAAVEMAALTDGVFTPVRHPGDLVDLIEEVRFGNIEQVSVRNVTLGADADPLVTNADGSWSALVPLAPGRNEIEVVARASGGVEAHERLTLVFAAGAPDPVLPGSLVRQRNRLLERKIVELRRGRLETERDAAEATRRELLLEIERERSRAQERAARQRKQLDLEVEAPDAARGAGSDPE